MEEVLNIIDQEVYLASGVEEPNALVQIIKDKGKNRPQPIRATQIEIYEGLNTVSQNCWPSVNFDFGSINNLFSPYYSCWFLLQNIYVASKSMGKI